MSIADNEEITAPVEQTPMDEEDRPKFQYDVLIIGSGPGGG